MMKQDSITPTTATTTTTTTTGNQPKLCGNCGTKEKKLIHNVRVRGNFRRLCTSCVLRLHPQNFCPTCLGVYERSPPEDAVVCFKCYSYSHPHCVTLPPAGSISSNRGPSPCSSCLNPNSLKLNLNLNLNRGQSRSGSGSRVIDLNAARILLAAGKIASNSMNKAEVAAAQEAERRSKEAAYTKKRAREALDHVVKLMGREKINNVSESSNNSKKVFHGSNGVVAMPYVVVNSNKGDPSSEVLDALNAVELKESGRQVQGGSVESVVSNTQGNGVVGMEVDVGRGNGNDLGFNSIAENGSVKSDDLTNVVEGETICNSHEQGLEKVNAVEENSVLNPQH